MSNEQLEDIQKIRRDSQASQRIKDSLNHSIQALAKDLYSKDTHFIFELIQNAEDNSYGQLNPSLSFRLTKTDPTGTPNAHGALIIENNEKGFTFDNVDAICAVGKTTKRKMHGYIGEKGIGFKSVFRVTTTPYIFSNGYFFCLPEHDDETGLGYIVPRWVEDLQEKFKVLRCFVWVSGKRSGRRAGGSAPKPPGFSALTTEMKVLYKRGARRKGRRASDRRPSFPCLERCSGCFPPSRRVEGNRIHEGNQGDHERSHQSVRPLAFATPRDQQWSLKLPTRNSEEAEYSIQC